MQPNAPSHGSGASGEPVLSIVVPMRNEEASIEPFLATVLPVLRQCCGDRFEVVAVNDGSSDGTLDRLLSQRIPQLRVIDLSRNFGKEAALTAGLQHARGQAVIPM
ncbi:MAG: glycosyltransferase, partial [Planctomycetes bacterium]|nr:glycosyltransferase [Planctomycetota bacterium]